MVGNKKVISKKGNKMEKELIHIIMAENKRVISKTVIKMEKDL